MTRRVLLPLFLGLLAALPAPAVASAAEGGGAVPPLPVQVPDVGATVEGAVGGVTETAAPVVEAVTSPAPAPSPPPASSGGSTGTRPAGEGTIERTTKAAAEAVPAATKAVTEAASGAVGTSRGADAGPASEAAEPEAAAPEPPVGEPTATASTAGSNTSPGRPATPRRSRRDPRAEPTSAADGPTETLARAVLPLIEGAGKEADSPGLVGTVSNLVSGLDSGFVALTNPLDGGPDAATPGGTTQGAPVLSLSDAHVADHPSPLHSFFDPEKPASILFFLLVLAAGAALLAYAFRREPAPSLRPRFRRRL